MTATLHIPNYLAIILVLTLTPPCKPNTRKLLRTFNVSKLIGESPNSGESEPVWGLAFSPDETGLAIGFGQHWTSDPRVSRGHVIIVPVGKPETVLQRFDFDGSPTFSSSKNLRWSPSGKLLAIQDHIFNIEGQPCAFPQSSQFGGFLSRDRMVTFQGSSYAPTSIQVRLPDCSVEESWQVGSSHVLATCPDRGWLAVRPSYWSANELTNLEIVSVPGHKTVRQWTRAAGALFDEISFADSCTLVCGGQPAAQGDKQAHAACWDIHTGEKASENPEILLDPPVETFGAVSQDWAASTVYKIRCIAQKFFEALDMGGCFTSSKRRILWNVRTGQEVASWGLSEQRMEMGGRAHRVFSEPSALALSANHELMAEGGTGLVHVYSLP